MLRSLSVEYASVTDEGMHRLCEVYDLEYLNIYCCRSISPKSVAEISHMSQLRTAGVGGTGIAPEHRSTAAVKELQRLLPGCRVDFGD